MSENKNPKPLMCSECVLYEDSRIDIDGPADPDLVFVGDFPRRYDISRGAFFSKGNNIVRQVCRDLDKQLMKAKQPKKVYTYGVQCCPESQEYKVYAETYDKCSGQLRMYLEQHKPKVIMTFGTSAMRCLGLKGTVSALRGGLYPYRYGSGEPATIIPTYDTNQVLKQPGLVPTLKTDIEKAYTLLTDDISIDDFDIRTPITVPDILKELKELRDSADVSYKSSGRPLGVSIDMEATGLEAYVEELRMIAISLSWGDNIGLAFPYEHRECIFSPEDLQLINREIEQTLNRPSVTLIKFNAKFDYQWLTLKYKLDLPFAKYDGMLAEHLLDEDKKGNYSLKVLTKDYFPAFGNYEEELKEELERINSERKEAYNKEIAEIKKARQNAMLEYWMSLNQTQRTEICAKWMTKGYRLGNYQDLIEVKWRKYKGEMVVLKKYQAAVAKMLAKIEPEDLEIELPEFDLPEPNPATFEDIRFDTLLKYAAIDAIMTRLIARKQQERFRAEDLLFRNVEKEINAKLQSDTLRNALRKYSMPACKVISEMEYGGVRLDRERTKQYIETLEETLKEYEDKMFSDLGYKFNTHSSAPDLKKILFEDKKYTPFKYSNETGEPSTDAESLKELYDKYDDEFLKNLLTHRKIDKCVNTYLKSWLEKSAYDGRIHCHYGQIGTATHRLNSTNPNLQNVPFELKEAGLNLKALFIPDSDEYDFYDLDISNAEMRVLCAYAQDQVMIDAFNNGMDMHCLTAEGISEYDYDTILKYKEDKTSDQYKQRQVAKKVNFGNKIK